MRTLEELTRLIREERRAALIINDRSRASRRYFGYVARALRERGFTVTEARHVRNPRQLDAAIQAVTRQEALLVVVGGGDGTISSITGYFAYQERVLGLLPLGTGNSFALTLGIPLDLDGALDVIANGTVAEITLGKVNDHYFANVVDVGISAVMARATSRWLKRYLGKFAYPIVGVRVLLHHRPFHCRLRVDGREEAFMTHEVIIANGRFYGDTPITADASISDEELDVVTIKTLSRGRLALLWLAFAFGKHESFPELHRYRGREITLETDPVQTLDIDGETLLCNPATFAPAPRALKILVPGEE